MLCGHWFDRQERLPVILSRRRLEILKLATKKKLSFLRPESTRPTSQPTPTRHAWFTFLYLSSRPCTGRPGRNCKAGQEASKTPPRPPPRSSPKGFSIMVLPYLPRGPKAAILGGFLLHLVMGTLVLHLSNWMEDNFRGFDAHSISPSSFLPSVNLAIPAPLAPTLPLILAIISVPTRCTLPLPPCLKSARDPVAAEFTPSKLNPNQPPILQQHSNPQRLLLRLPHRLPYFLPACVRPHHHLQRHHFDLCLHNCGPSLPHVLRRKNRTPSRSTPCCYTRFLLVGRRAAALLERDEPVGDDVHVWCFVWVRRWIDIYCAACVWL